MEWQRTIKYGIDRCFGVVGTVMLAPAFIVLAAAIWLDDRGPVLFKQERPGLGGESFEVFKFRTMIVDADDHLDAQGRPTRSRVTRLGRALRRLSLDELPQVVNIARGEMSIVGPRPALPSHVGRYTDEQRGRFRMKPGITGLAQVNGRNSLKWSKRIEYDNEYIDNYTLLSDVRILARTVRVVLAGSDIAPDRNSLKVDDLGPAGSAAVRETDQQLGGRDDK